MTIKDLEIIDIIGGPQGTYTPEPIKVRKFVGRSLTEALSFNSPADHGEPTTLALRMGWTLNPRMKNIMPISSTETIIPFQGDFEISAFCPSEYDRRFCELIIIRGKNLNRSG